MMSRQIIKSTVKFRDVFSVPDRSKLQWFPGHMKRGIDQIQSRLKDIDAVLEVHDARIPFSGRNPQIQQVLQLRPHLMVLNKADLADLSHRQKITEKLKSQGISQVSFVNCRQKYIISKVQKEIFPKMFHEIESRPRYKQSDLGEYHIMVIGIPNVGKSTLLNKMRHSFTRKGKGSVVGASPGVTRSVMNKVRVSFDPTVYVFDTPGILSPKIPDVQTGMRLALCGCVPPHLVGEERIVDYFLFWMNMHGNFSYVDFYGLQAPTEDVLGFLTQVAIHKKLMTKVATGYRPKFTEAAAAVIKDFQTGYFGKVLLDGDLIAS